MFTHTEGTDCAPCIARCSALAHVISGGVRPHSPSRGGSGELLQGYDQIITPRPVLKPGLLTARRLAQAGLLPGKEKVESTRNCGFQLDLETKNIFNFV